MFTLKKILLPSICRLCQQTSFTNLDLCTPCLDELPFFPAHCPRCSTPSFTPTMPCGKCVANPPAYDSTFALFSYTTPITKLIMELKFHACLVNARLLGNLMAQALQREYYTKALPEMIIPVPLHVERMRTRGFNQALELAKPIAKQLEIPLRKAYALRKINTAAQATLVFKNRGKTLRNAFVINPLIINKHIAVLDDVITTGQTISAFTKACKNAGARQIDVWCVAKTQMD